MAQINYHPAPGLGNILPGFYAVPQNPFEGPVTVTPRIGDILPALYTLPQNPLKDFMSGQVRQIARDPGKPGVLNGVTVGDCGCGGSCGGCGGIGMGGISDDLSAIGTKISSGDIMGTLQAPVMGIPLGLIIAAAIALPMFLGPARRR